MKAKKKKRHTLKLFLIILAPIVLFCIGIGYCTSISGFSVSKIQSNLPYDSNRDVAPISSEDFSFLEDIFSKPFVFLDDGARCYSFVSADGKYVLKLFKMYRLTAKNWLNYIPIPKILDNYRFEKIDKRNLKLWDAFASCKLAYNMLKQETGLVYLHLNKTRDLKTKVLLIDQNDKKHRLDLDGVEFIVQKRAIPLYQKVRQYVEKGDYTEAQKAIVQVLHLVKNRTYKKIVNPEVDRCDVTRNYGFIGDTCVHLDVAGFCQTQDSQEMEGELLKTFEKLRQWAHENYPELEQGILSQIMEEKKQDR